LEIGTSISCSSAIVGAARLEHRWFVQAARNSVRPFAS
jgi:hypothetical protein